MDELRQLSSLNTNYDPPQPWQCMSDAAHECTGEVIGALGVAPVCEPGATAERIEREQDRARIRAWTDSPEGRAALAEEAAMERRIEFGGH